MDNNITKSFGNSSLGLCKSDQDISFVSTFNESVYKNIPNTFPVNYIIEVSPYIITSNIFKTKSWSDYLQLDIISLTSVEFVYISKITQYHTGIRFLKHNTSYLVVLNNNIYNKFYNRLMINILM